MLLLLLPSIFQSHHTAFFAFALDCGEAIVCALVCRDEGIIVDDAVDDAVETLPLLPRSRTGGLEKTWVPLYLTVLALTGAKTMSCGFSVFFADKFIDICRR
jgi:hypothetical protein